MIKGIGIDMVDLREFRGICEGAFKRRAFTAAELAQAEGRRDPVEYLAGRFACKEAVFKALAPLTREGFDLRAVETLDAATGQPEVTLEGRLAPVLAETGVSSVLVSITNEGDYVSAIALAQ